MEVISTFYPNISTTNNLVPYIFGCMTFVHIQNRDKLDPWVLKCMFVRYSIIQRGYKCYHLKSRKVFFSTDVTFNEWEPYYTPSL